MEKRIVSLALALFLVAALLPAPALAYDTGTAGQDNTISAGFSMVGVLGGGHTGFVDKSGALWMWGGNNNGQLGNGTTDSSDVPVKVLDNVVTVSCGSEYTAAIKTDGALWMWGENHDGRLGNGTTEDSLVPMKVLDNVATVSCGGCHTAAIKTDGTLWMWGENGYSQLGNGGGENAYGEQTVPIKVLDNVAAVSCGVHHTAAIKTDGTLWMWGLNEDGELGNGGGGNLVIEYTNGSVAYQTVPVKVLDNVAAVSCGYVCTAAIKTDGSLWMWGENDHGQLGNGGGENAYGEHTVPIKVLDNVAAVSCGSTHTAAIKTDGTPWTWGSNWSGQLGNVAATPIQIAVLDAPSHGDPAADITADVVDQEPVGKTSSGSFPTGAIIAVAAVAVAAVVLVLKKKKAQAAAPAAVASPPAQAAPKAAPSPVPEAPPAERPAPTPNFCPNCGQKLQNGVRFCPNCGQALSSSES